MPNPFFHFKQFTVHQDRCAMKVCTDACLFGAWVAREIAGDDVVSNILDIGTGTGLLSLLLAQKNNASIDAVELSTDAASQASENFVASPWKSRLKIHHCDIRRFDPAYQYDLIISNPPFFEDDLKSEDEHRNTAMHSTTFTLDELLKQIKRLLKQNGAAAVLIPFHRNNYFENILELNGFFIKEVMQVKQTVRHTFFRSMYIFTKYSQGKNEGEITIQNEEKQYTAAFAALLKDYYLKL